MLLDKKLILFVQKRNIVRKLPRIAKTKLFQVRIPEILPKEEQLLENEWQSYYSENLKSIMTHFAQVELYKHERGGKDDLERQIEEEELELLLKENDLQNEKIGKIREEHTMKDWLDKKKKEIKIFLHHKDKAMNALEKAELDIINLQAKSETFVTTEKQLDKLIESAFSNIIDHNFAVTITGEKIMGDVLRKSSI